MIKNIIKRDNSLVPFKKEKIVLAIFKAASSVDGDDFTLAEKMADKVIIELVKKYNNEDICIEDVQDMIEKVLVENGKAKTAKAFILYREKRRSSREETALIGAVINLFGDYLNDLDWRINENANTQKSIGGLNNYIREKFTKHYWLNEIYTENIRKSHTEGNIHIHDLGLLAPYCLEGNTKVLLLNGEKKKIKDLVKEYKDKSFWVYSVNKNGDVVPGLAHNPRKTRKNADLVKIGFYNKYDKSTKYLTCTPDHKILLRNNMYKEAKDLIIGDSLMPLFVHKRGNYLAITNKGKEEYVHRYVMEQVVGTLGGDVVVHHMDGNKYNNDISNLEIINDRDHRKLEIRKTMKTDKWMENNTQRLVEYNKSDDKRQQISEYALSRERDEQGKFFNHKVVSIEYLNKKKDVYCMTVEDHNNFAIEGGIFVHNCAGWDLKQLLYNGFGIDGKNKSRAPKHLRSFLGQIVNSTFSTQGECAGAQAWSNFDTYCAPFVRYDNMTYKEVKKAIRDFIINLNVPTRVGFQCPFSNLTMDITVPSSLKDTSVIYGGQILDDKYGDFQKEIDVINKAFCEVMLEGDAEGNVYTFPIPTLNITKDIDWTSDVLKEYMNLSCKYGIPYFTNFINSDYSPEDSFSMCPLTADTEVLVKSSEGIRITNISDIYNNVKQKNTKYKVWTPEGWSKFNPIRMEKTKVYEIKLSNGTTVKMGENHMQPVKGFGTLLAKDLKVGMWLPYNKIPVTTDNIGSYDIGYIIGSYVGDGSHDGSAITYTICGSKKSDHVEKILVSTWNYLGYDVNVTNNDEDNIRFIRVNGNPYDIINRFIDGDKAITKSLKNIVFNMSKDFKRGLLGGLKDTDGARDKNRLYTSSPELRIQLNTLFSMMGNKCIINYKDDRKNRFEGSKTNYRIDYPNRKKYGNIFDSDDEFNYYSIVSIEETQDSHDSLYCFEVENKSHLFMLANGLLTHNCHLRLDKSELKKRGGGLFGSDALTGSIGVVTVNVSRLAYNSKTKSEFFIKLWEQMDIAKTSLEIKRKIIEKQTENGLYPFSKLYLKDTKMKLGSYWANHFSTIGIVGMNEACQNLLGEEFDISTVEGKEFALETLNYMRNAMQEFQNETGNIYNLEATPAEGTSYSLAEIDKNRYPGIITSGEKVSYYTNSTLLPANYTTDILKTLQHQDELQQLYTGGTVLHLYMGEKLPDVDASIELLKTIFTNFKLPYITFTPTFSTCPNHGYLAGEHFNCPHCGTPSLVWTRVVGYLRPVQHFHKGKKEEYRLRTEYDINTIK